MAEDKVKKIRELDDFLDPNPMTTGDHLIVSSSEGPPVTNKATIKDVVSLYLSQQAEEAIDVEDTITLENGDVIANPLKGATTIQGEDTDGDGVPDKLIESVTTITSNNIDSLVQEGGGLETITTCRDEGGLVVDCELPDGSINTEVKYKTTKLVLARSAESKTINIDCNANEGVVYEPGLTMIDGKLNKKFKRLRDAFKYIQKDVSASDTIININIETDIDEGEIANTNIVYSCDTNVEINRCVVNISGANSGIASNPPKIKMKSKHISTGNSYVLMWLTATNISLRFLHFVFDCDDNPNIHSIIRSHKNCFLNVYGCKFSARGEAHTFLEGSRGGSIEFHSISDDLGSLDYKEKGFWIPAIELDFGPRKAINSLSEGTIGESFKATKFIGLDSGATFRQVEYGPHITWNREFNTNFQARTHFCSNDMEIKNFIHMEQNCIVDMISLFTITNGATITADNINNFFRASSFNSINIAQGYHMAGDIANGYAELINIDVPGESLFAPGNTVGIDYAIVPSDLEATLDILSTYKGRDSTQNATQGSLTNYWDNVDWTQDYDNL